MAISFKAAGRVSRAIRAISFTVGFRPGFSSKFLDLAFNFLAAFGKALAERVGYSLDFKAGDFAFFRTCLRMP